MALLLLKVGSKGASRSLGRVVYIGQFFLLFGQVPTPLGFSIVPALTALSSSVGVARGGGDVDGLSSSGADYIARALQSLVGDDAVNFYGDR